MNPADIKLPHDDLSILAYEWTSRDYLMALAGVCLLLAFVFLLYFGWKWLAGRDKERKKASQLDNLRMEAAKIAVASNSDQTQFVEAYSRLSIILRNSVDIVHGTNLTHWNFHQISSNTNLLSKYFEGKQPQVLGFFGRADRCIYSGSSGSESVFTQDKKFVIGFLKALRLKQHEQTKKGRA